MLGLMYLDVALLEPKPNIPDWENTIANTVKFGKKKQVRPNAH